jgi:hypothetical protein
MSKRKYKKMFINDECSEWIWARVIAGKHRIDYDLTIHDAFVNSSRRGVPWKCLLSRGTVAVAAKQPSLFPHPVKFAYTEGTNIFVLTHLSPKNSNRYPLAVQYRHNFTKTLRVFDVLSKEQFKQQFSGKPVQIRLKPPFKNRNTGHHAESRPQVARQPTEHEAGEKHLVGARQRALNANLLNLKNLNGERPTT